MATPKEKVRSMYCITLCCVLWLTWLAFASCLKVCQTIFLLCLVQVPSGQLKAVENVQKQQSKGNVVRYITIMDLLLHSQLIMLQDWWLQVLESSLPTSQHPTDSDLVNPLIPVSTRRCRHLSSNTSLPPPWRNRSLCLRQWPQLHQSPTSLLTLLPLPPSLPDTTRRNLGTNQTLPLSINLPPVCMWVELVGVALY